MEIALKTLAPIWTGDIDKNSSILLENGILGSLRWWSEAVYRGYGYPSCDPTNDNNRCPKNENEYCASCFVFGGTSRRKLFKIQIEGGKTLFQQYIPIKPIKRDHGWYYPGSGLIGDISIRIIPFNNTFKREYVALPITIASRWGAIGAKTQLGYGVIKLIEIPDIQISECFKFDLKSKFKIRRNIRNQNQYPNLKEMFFAKVNFNVKSPDWWKEINGIKKNSKLKEEHKDNLKELAIHGTIPIYPVIKNWLRYGKGKKLWELNNRYLNQRISNFLFGTIRKCCPFCFTSGKGLVNDKNHPKEYIWCKNCKKSIKNSKVLDKIASKIHVSFAYKINNHHNGSSWEFRIWGWIPNSENSPLMNRDELLNRLKESLIGDSNELNINWENLLGSKVDIPHLVNWREFNSTRDMISQYTDYTEYLQSLILKKEGSHNG